MARGDNPNSRENLKKGKKFESNDERTRKAGIASGESRRFQSCAKNALKDICTDEALTKAMARLVKLAEQGSIPAIKMLLEYTAAKEEQQTSNNITVVIDKKDYDEWTN